MKTYITASGIISPQETYPDTGFPEKIMETVSNRLFCMEPDYRDLINPIQLRRMPRILKMGLASAQLCINRSSGAVPDAIIVGTGLGCLDNLERFLKEMINSGEHITSVLPFINSTHNAIAAQVAMLLKNHGYNLTYCHRAFSFESALDDALLMLDENGARNILVGGVDECTSDFLLLHSYLGYWKDPISNLSLIPGKSPGTIAGEGSAFFMLTGDHEERNLVALEGVQTYFSPDGAVFSDVVPEIDSFLESHGTCKEEIPVILTGMNGDQDSDQIYMDLRNNYFAPETGIAVFKHLCGDYFTSSAFALWLGKVILEQQKVPPQVLHQVPGKSRIDKLLIYNHYRKTEHAMMLLSYGHI